ncbi:hypothetical protein KEM54_003386 [Ascosphaera aggregata]|nr:hypothetical protein KEM54_003386 [Ascosphaera aggregata]
MVAEELRDGNIQDAQGILDAAGITSPHGDLVRGCYDETGILYRLEPVLVSDPPLAAMAIEDHPGRARGDSSSTAGELASGTEDSVSKGIDAADRPLSEGGKIAKMHMPCITVKVRLSDSDRNMEVRIGKDQHVRALERQIRADADISPDTRIRMVHLGKLLDPHKTLGEQRWIPRNVIIVYIQNALR